MAAIEVADLIKTYRFHRKEPGLLGSLRSLLRRESLETRAVDGVSFSIEAGGIVGFLGPSGAGKTTTLKVLSGLLYPSAGHVRVLGYEPSRRQHDFLRQITLVMGQKSMLWWDIPAMETLLLHKQMYGIPDAVFRRSVGKLAGLLEVEHLLRVQVRKLSLGERMKMKLLAALVHQPRVLFLDEPTIGLDVVSQQRMRDFLRRLNQEQGTTVLLTSHYMADIEALCPRVLLIAHGRLHFDGPLAKLIEQAAPHKRVGVTYDAPVPPADVSAALAGLPDAVSVSTIVDSREIELDVPRAGVAGVAERLLRLGRVVDLSVEDVAVEEIVRGLFGAAGAASAAAPLTTSAGETARTAEEVVR